MHSRQRMAVHELMLFVAERCAEKNRREHEENKKKKGNRNNCTMYLQLVTFYSFIINLEFTTFHRPVPFFFSFLSKIDVEPLFLT